MIDFISFKFEPSPLMSFTLSLGNYAILLAIFYIAKQNKLINNQLFILSIIMLLSPFLMNGLLFPWTQLPDQTKYLAITNHIRQNLFSLEIFNFIISDLKLRLPGIFFGISPLLTTENFQSIGFINRFFFILTFIFLIKKKYLSLNLKLLIILSPSLMVYSSVALRDNLILLAMIWSVYFLMNKSYILLILTVTFLFFVKVQNFLILIFFYWIFMTFTNHKYKKFKLFLKILALGFIISCFYFSDQLLEIVDNLRYGLYAEHIGYENILAEPSYKSLTFDANLILMLLKSNVSFLFSPIDQLNSFFNIITFLEVIAIYFIMIKSFRDGLKIEKIKNLTRIWIVVFIGCISLYSLFIFNAGQLSRYRIVLLFFVLIGYEIHKSYYIQKQKLKEI
jgi:hypothetical protein